MAIPGGVNFEAGQVIRISSKGRKVAKRVGELATIIKITKRKVLVQYEKNGFIESFLRVDVENNLDRLFELRDPQGGSHVG